ncbi:MAG: NAD-binding protein, partial [Actinomycetes bacterium]
VIVVAAPAGRVIDGAHPANTVIIGAGTAGTHAASVAVGLQAQVTMIDRDPDRLAQVAKQWPGQVRTVLADNGPAMHELFAAADLIVCAALVAGARAPVIVAEADVARMSRGSVLVDIAVDQGGNYELAHPTTHGEPTFLSHDVLISCITNLPAAVPRTSTFALSSAISGYVIELADQGWQGACAGNPALAGGINVSDGRVVHPALLS